MGVHHINDYRGQFAPARAVAAAAHSPLLAPPLCIHHRNPEHCFDCSEVRLRELRTTTAERLTKGAFAVSLAASLWCFAIAGLVIICGAH